MSQPSMLASIIAALHPLCYTSADYEVRLQRTLRALYLKRITSALQERESLPLLQQGPICAPIGTRQDKRHSSEAQHWFKFALLVGINRALGKSPTARTESDTWELGLPPRQGR